MIPNVLTIAGSDPSGGAGIQADLKTFSALGCYGMSVITSLTAQNTQGVRGIYPIPSDFVVAQLTAILEDIRIDGIKIGMLANHTICSVLATILRKHPAPFTVLDTVMIAKGGHPLLEEDAIDVIRQQLLPLVDMITPNLLEAAALLGCSPATTEEDMCEQGRQLLSLGCKSVLMKGGHLTSPNSPDWLISSKGLHRFTSKRYNTCNCHGTGCTLSAAIAALKPQHDLIDTINLAKNYVSTALQKADQLDVGQGIGPTHHFFHWW